MVPRISTGAEPKKLDSVVELDDLGKQELHLELEDWQDHYNWHRIHGATGQTPMDKLLDRWSLIPDHREIMAQYNRR